MLIRPELGGKGTGCLFQFTYCENISVHVWWKINLRIFEDHALEFMHFSDAMSPM